MTAWLRLELRSTRRRRALPEHDDSLSTLERVDRELAVAVWRGRAEAELRAGGSFAYLTQVLVEANAPGHLVALARRAVTDEQLHGQLCWRVACAIAGKDLPPPRVLRPSAPSHRDANPQLRRALLVLGMCCVNETTGSAFLEVCRTGVRGATAAAALHALLADEIDHARLGWAFLASPAVDAGMRDALAAWLPRLLASNLSAWRDRPPVAVGDAVVAQGCPDWSAVDEAVLGAAKDLVIPGFAALGIDVTAAHAWLTAAAS